MNHSNSGSHVSSRIRHRSTGARHVHRGTASPRASTVMDSAQDSWLSRKAVAKKKDKKRRRSDTQNNDQPLLSRKHGRPSTDAACKRLFESRRTFEAEKEGERRSRKSRKTVPRRRLLHPGMQEADDVRMLPHAKTDPSICIR